jgi:hypothetical protein
MAGLCDDAVQLSYFSFFSNPLVDLLSMYRDFLWRVYPDPDLFASGLIPTPSMSSPMRMAADAPQRTFGY